MSDVPELVNFLRSLASNDEWHPGTIRAKAIEAGGVIDRLAAELAALKRTLQNLVTALANEPDIGIYAEYKAAQAMLDKRQVSS